MSAPGIERAALEREALTAFRRRCAFGASLIAAVVSVALHRANTHAEPRTPQAEIAHAWSLTSTETLAIEGLGGKLAALDAEVARVASRDPAKAEQIVKIGLALRAIDAQRRELEAQAALDRRLDVAVVQSTSGWIAVPKK